MNISYFYKYIAERLDTDIVSYLPGGETREMLAGEKNDSALLTREVTQRLLASAAGTPVIACVNERYYYGLIRHGEEAVLLGPVYSSHIITLANGLNLNSGIKVNLGLRECTLNDFFDAILLIHNVINDAELEFEELVNSNFYNNALGDSINRKINEIRFEYSEDSRSHDPFDMEKRLVSAIKSGNVKLITEATMKIVRGTDSIVSEDTLLNDRSLAVVGITVASRAAIAAGVSAEVIMSLTDSYIQEINRLRSHSEIETVVFHCNIQLAKLVSDYNNSRSSSPEDTENYYSEKAKNYVATHINSALTVDSIAAELGITPNYLSAVFSKSQGQPLSRYIMSEKIQLAKNLLLYSDRSYSEIAMYLGFSSQSHFCSTFKKLTGTTPSAYIKHLK